MKLAWLFGFSLFSITIFGQDQLPQKFSPALHNLSKQKRSGDSIKVILNTKNAPLLEKKNLRVLAEYKPTGTALVKLTLSSLLQLAKENKIIFADVARVPKEELTTGALDISLNKISYSHHQFPSTNGDSVFVSIKEQEFDSTDIDINGRYFNSGVGSASQTIHASIMATILGGAGNTSPYAKGAAPGSYLTSSDFVTLLPDADSVYQAFNISVQNHSYGTAIENYYGGDAAAYDQSSKNVPSLLHIFSAGNVGNTASDAGPYAGLQGYANLTGSFKMGKNSIAVGATDSFNHVSPLSSKGPAYDGRVKPELVAFGEDGTSGAAALVSGTAALVQQAYRNSGHASLPTNALIKAVLLNSADDVERPNIDYASGYGALNAFGAVRTIFEKRYSEDSVAQGETKTFSFSIPKGTSLAKFTVTWMDTPAEPNAAKALVNDIDATLLLPASGENWLPWVLNSGNHLDSITQLAKRNRDTLNTTEQITLENPVAGDYLLQINGSHIEAGKKQSFAIAYQFDTAKSFQWTYPTSTDALVANTSHIVRWQTNIRDTASLDYSFDGTHWHTTATGINLQDQFIQWKTPDTTAFAFFRMRVSKQNISSVSDSFTISQPLQLSVGFNCVDSFLLFWNSLPVEQYQVLVLGPKYLQSFLLASDTMTVLRKSGAPFQYYSVAPVVGNKTGFRSFTVDYTTQGVGCFVSSFLATLQNNKAVLHVQLGSVYSVDSIRITRRNGIGTAVINTFRPPLTTDFFFEDPMLAAGVNNYQLALYLSNGQVVFSNVETLYFFPKQPVIVYPNPAAQNEPIQVIAQSPGEFTIYVYDALGRQIAGRFLDDISQQVQPFRLGKGIYFIAITGSNGDRFTQRLVVY